MCQKLIQLKCVKFHPSYFVPAYFLFARRYTMSPSRWLLKFAALLLFCGFRPTLLHASLLRQSINPKQLEELVHSECVNPGHFALTFDDGPAPGTTDSVLDVLRLNNVTATFFLCGQTYSDLNSLEGEGVVRRILAEGHQIGIHTWSHRYLPDHWRTANEVRVEIASVAQKLLQISGSPVRIMRPPYGAYNETVLNIVINEFNLEVIMWNVNTLDWSHPGDTEAAIENYRIDTNGSSPSNNSFIALHHDPLVGSADLAQAAIDFMKRLGYTFVSVGECIGLV